MVTPRDWETVDEYGFPLVPADELIERRTAQKQAHERAKRQNRRTSVAVLGAAVLAFCGGYLVSSNRNILDRQDKTLKTTTLSAKEWPRDTQRKPERQMQTVKYVDRLPSQPVEKQVLEPEVVAEAPPIMPESAPEQILPEGQDMTGGASPEIYQTGGAAPQSAP